MTRTMSVLAAAALGGAMLSGIVMTRARDAERRGGPAEGHIATILEEAALPATLAPAQVAFYAVAALEIDRTTGSLYFIDKARHMIFRFAASEGRVEAFAGTQLGGFNGEGLSARATRLHVPGALAVDQQSGDVYVADTQNHRIRVIPRSGQRVSAVAGMGIAGIPPDQLPTVFPAIEGFRVGHFSGDGGPALHAELNLPSGVAVGPHGVVFVADSGNHRIRAVNRSAAPVTVAKVRIEPGTIKTIAGSGRLGFAGDGGTALEAALAFPTELKADPAGNLFLIDTFNHRLRRVDARSGRIHTIATGSLAHLGAEQTINTWQLSLVGLGLAPDGAILFTDRLERAVYRATAAGELELLFADEDGQVGPGSIAVADRDTVLVADVYSNRVVRIADGTATTLAGGAPAGENAPVHDATFSILGPIAVDSQGDLYVADAMHYSVRRVFRRERVVRTFMGTGRLGTGGDGRPPLQASLVHPTDLAFDAGGGLLVTDQYGHTLRHVTVGPSGTIVQTLAGRPGSRAPVEGEPATAGRLGGPLAVARHPHTGELYVSCQETHSIRRIDKAGRIHTIAGTGAPGSSGDGGPAREAALNWPAALAFDARGALYVSDLLNNRIRVIDAAGRIETFAGTGARGYSGDGGPARDASLASPGDLVFDADGNLYVSDTNNHRVRRIDGEAPYHIRTVAGNGERGFSGDGGPATDARLSLPRGLAIGPDGTLYVVDSFNRRIRAVGLRPPRTRTARAAL